MFNRLLVVGFLSVIRQVPVHTLTGCRILSGYPTSSSSYAYWLSDSFRLSDKFRFIPLLVVGFFSVIRQVPVHTLADCRILLGYPTSSGSYVYWLSDSSRLSDKLPFIRLPVVGFFSVIRQVPVHTLAGCRILSGYPTSSKHSNQIYPKQPKKVKNRPEKMGWSFTFLC